MLTREQALSALTGPGGRFEVIRGTVNGVEMPLYRHLPNSMRDVLLATRQFDERTFLVYEDERYSYRQHFDQVATIATLLIKDGVRKGDRVAIGMRNYPEWVSSFWACQAIGAVAVTLNAWWTGDELQYALEDSGSKAALIDGERWARIRDLRPASLQRCYLVRGDGVDAGDTVDLLAALRALGPCQLPDVNVGPDDDSTMLYTSGTTGRSKGAVGTHRNHLTNLANTQLGGALALEIAELTHKGQPVAGVEMPTPNQGVTLQTFPFFHIGGLAGLYVSTAAGSRIVLMYRWDASKAAELIERERVSSFSAVPTVVRQLLETAAEQGRQLDSLLGIASGGAPVPPDLINRIGSQFESRVQPGNGYGLTETTSAVVTNGGADYFARPDSVGRTVVVAESRIVDDNGNDVPNGTVGEIWVKGPNVVRGYWNKPEATAEAFTNGWFHTGDLGYRNDEGFHYVVDRKKDVVIRGGENVYCAEVEAVLFRHPAVQDVAIIGLPHRELGEEVAAVIQPRLGMTVSDADLQAHVAVHLARFKVPSKIFRLSEPLPRTATGKVLKRDLRRQFGDL